VGKRHFSLLGFLLQDGDFRLEVGRRNGGDQSPLEAAAQAVFDLGELLGRAVAGDHDLLHGVVQRVESLEELFLGALLAGEELDVIGEQNVNKKYALEIMKLNVTAFPESPNAHDNLSDAYLTDGQEELSRQNAKKAIELLASDTTDPQARRDAIRENAQLKLAQLGEAQP